MENTHRTVGDDEAVERGPPPLEEATRRIRGARTNASILGHESNQFPSTLKDLIGEYERNASRFSKTLSRISDCVPGLPTAFWTGNALNQVRYSRQLYSGLPHAVDGAKHVFVVTRPHTGWPVSWLHWSVYSQGYFYHLTAGDDDVPFPKNPMRQTHVSGVNSGAGRIPIRPRTEDLSTTTRQDYIDAVNVTPKKTLTAFEVGRTRYSPEDIRRLAEWVIEELDKHGYDLLEASCQIFTQSLLCRVVMTQRDSSIFVGTKTQLVDWDLHGRPDHNAFRPNNVDSGFLIRKPRVPTSRSIMSAYPLY